MPRQLFCPNPVLFAREYLVKAVLDLPRRALLPCRALVAEALDVHAELVRAERITHKQIQLHPVKKTSTG